MAVAWISRFWQLMLGGDVYLSGLLIFQVIDFQMHHENRSDLDQELICIWELYLNWWDGLCLFP